MKPNATWSEVMKLNREPEFTVYFPRKMPLADRMRILERYGYVHGHSLTVFLASPLFEEVECFLSL